MPKAMKMVQASAVVVVISMPLRTVVTSSFKAVQYGVGAVQVQQASAAVPAQMKTPHPAAISLSRVL